jgi:tetratricopeptide (TPR) repeat protein
MNTKINQALNYIGQDAWLPAKDLLKELIAREPDTEIFYELYGYCLRRLETEEIQETPLRNVPAGGLFSSESFEKMYKKAEKFSQAGDYLKGAVLWQMCAVYAEKTLAENPPAKTALPSLEMRQLARLYYAQAECHYLRGYFQEAKEAFLRSCEIELHAFREYPLTTAEIYMQMGDFAKAEDILLRALENKEEGVAEYEVHRTRAEIFGREGNNDCAQSEYELARMDLEERLQKEPLDMHLYSILADVLDKLGRTEEALSANAKAVALWSTYPKTYFQRAKLLAARKDEKGAGVEMKLGTACEVYYPGEYFLDKGEIYERLGKWKEAEVCYLSASGCDARYIALKRLYIRRNAPKKLEKLITRMKSRKTVFWQRVSEAQLAELCK